MILLPRNPSIPQPSQTRTARVIRTHSIARRVDLTHSNDPTGSSQAPVDRRNTVHHRVVIDYGPILREKLAAAETAQNLWLEDIRNETALQETIRRETLLLIKGEQDRIANEERERERRAFEQRLNEEEARIARVAEAQRLEAEVRERERVQRQQEAEQQRREEEELLAVREALVAEELRFEEEEQWRVAQELVREQERYEAVLAAQLAAEEARRQEAAEEAERQRIARQRDCTVCMESHDMGVMVQAPCSHWYCRDDIRGALQAALDSRTTFRCCRQQVQAENVANLLPTDLVNRYRSMTLELTTPNPVYCYNRSCGLFIPPSPADGPDNKRCLSCKLVTCRHCRNQAHSGECPADVDTQRLRALAATRGWKPCPRCAKMVEKTSGCNHISCSCGAQFCYRCGRNYPCSGCRG